MGASSSGLLDQAKISHVKGLVDSTFQIFSEFYRQQYSVAYFEHLHQEVEPKKEGRGLLLTHRPQYPPEEVLYQGNVKLSCWDEQGKKFRERYVILRRGYKVEIHDNLETFNRGGAAKLVLQPAGGEVFTSEEESRAHLDKTCAAILNGVKEDSSSVMSSPDVFAVYLHLPYMGHTCFLFQQAEERHHFLSGLKTCIRHCGLDPWCDSSHEKQAFSRALRLYRLDKGCYESWEMLLGTEEQVLASQVMEELLPWLHSQLQSRVKGKKTERIRLWLAMVQATYSLVLEQLAATLEVLREECRQTASANQALIRANLDEIMSSHCFLEQKITACICEEVVKVCSESVAPYMSSILEALTENISSGIIGMQQILHTEMDSAFSRTKEGKEDTKKALSSLSSISLDQSFRQVENLTEKYEALKQRFELGSAQRLIHSAHLEMEQLLDSAVYTLEQFLQSSSRLQPSQVPGRLERAKERVLKQLNYDSRVVQRRLYEETLLQITLPSLTRRMDANWKSELQQFEKHIFSDYSSFILVRNVYDDVLRNTLSKEIETVVQDAASKKTNNLLLDTSDLAISQYSLLGQTPPRSAPGSPANQARRSSAAPGDDQEPAAVVEDSSQTKPDAETKSEPRTSQSSEQIVSPLIVVTQQFDEEAPQIKEEEEVQIGADATQTAAESSHSDEAPEPPADPESTIPDSPKPPADPESTILDSPDPPADPESTIPDSPDPPADPESTILDSSDPESTIIDSPDPPADPESTIPDSPDPPADLESTIPDSPDPESTIIDSPDPPADPESTIPDSPDPPADPESIIPDSPDSPPQISSTDEPEPAKIENPPPSDLPTSDQTSEEPPSIQAPPPSPPPATESELKISLRSLSEAIGCSSTEESVNQTKPRQTTDRAVYLRGQIKDNWEMERLKEAGEKEGNEITKEEKEEVMEDGGGAQVNEDCSSTGPPAESATTSTTECEETLNEEETSGEVKLETRKEDEEKGDQEEKVKEDVLQSRQPIESQPEKAAELPLDSVAAIRELVFEVIEVETIVTPCPAATEQDTSGTMTTPDHD
ncbi:protein Niban 1-like [Amphiprion ocellaris]|uniref:Niban 1/2/3 domain-containing protein n=1 Tax=Amphiprion ocellaris TaxID=80972 RepID=A0A3Q1BEV1_AMPOC|nr:protein Niban 1-like [Amphiprion ocellaris]